MIVGPRSDCYEGWTLQEINQEITPVHIKNNPDNHVGILPDHFVESLI